MRAVWILALAISTLCANSVAGERPVPIKVVVTLFPLYDFCREVGGDLVDCSMLLPPGVEPHGFAPSPQDVLSMNKADVFLYTSELMEPWVDGFRKNLPSTTSVVEVGKGLATMSTSGHSGCDHGCTHQDHGEESASRDPHVWLDFQKAMTMVEVISKALSDAQPRNAATFERRAKAYVAKLKALDDRTRTELAKCELKTVISGGHFAFGYYVNRYGLSHQSPYDGFAPDAEPSPAAIAGLIDLLEEQRQTTLFTEEMLDDSVAKIIASETGAKLSLLHAAHNVTPEEVKRGETFISLMEGNLERLTEALAKPGTVVAESRRSSRAVGIGILVFIVAFVCAGFGLIIFSRKRA